MKSLGAQGITVKISQNINIFRPPLALPSIGDQSYEKKTLLFLILASAEVPVQYSMLGQLLGLTILLIFGWTFGQISTFCSNSE